MIVIGIDPGIARVGYGVVEKQGHAIRLITYGCIETEGKDRSNASRLLEIYGLISVLLDDYPADHASVERLFFAKNVTSAMQVSEVRGVILLAAEERQIPITEYTPNQIKQSVTGSGRAGKQQVQEMVRRLLGLNEIPRPDDAADALAAALCHINTLR
ncbi:MAG: crossover junction endodeoxyribonuclease RuvC [Methanomicrobiaceae archaeon]|uniref:Crossover junction endodeoxyribonuclease ruvc n=1 Tax=hydrocarbon metagenome TaxID=938273 RepID=A0A0W8FKG9_9ZZZZ|nr:crossover junction endodeoxyribonuclease RuvC [Methanomicrobiaceae archaeon]MDD5419142.1 crossover junction endodeoxyribonuclease RuvC [Methanomicrobiaceae archaeon]